MGTLTSLTKTEIDALSSVQIASLAAAQLGGMGTTNALQSSFQAAQIARSLARSAQVGGWPLSRLGS